jgi:serine phosphatase RsbU (regulator of sigma subunit)
MPTALDVRLFGEDRLESLLAKKGHGANASQWIARIEAAVREFARGRSQLDDITCLALRR